MVFDSAGDTSQRFESDPDSGVLDLVGYPDMAAMGFCFSTPPCGERSSTPSHRDPVLTKKDGRVKRGSGFSQPGNPPAGCPD